MMNSIVKSGGHFPLLGLYQLYYLNSPINILENVWEATGTFNPIST